MRVATAGTFANTQMDYWDKPLPLAVMPESGPLPLMVTLLDVNRALIGKLPQGYLKRAHWLEAGRTLVIAAQSGETRDVELVFAAVVDALIREGWMKRSISIPKPLRIGPPPSGPPPSEPFRAGPLRSEAPPAEPLRREPLRNVRLSGGDIAPRWPAEPLWRRLRPVSTDRRAAEGQQRASASLNPAPKDLEQFVREYLLVLRGRDG